MNGVHDLGGMHGFGPIRPEVNEPVFHADWEGRVRGMVVLTGAWRKWNVDAFRHAIERLPPADYLRLSYFEKWFGALLSLLPASGLVSQAEIANGRAAQGSPKAVPPLTAATVGHVITAIGSYRREVTTQPRFSAGTRVRARNIHPETHTRLPRYVRGHIGTVERDHGAHVLPDSNARFAGEAPQYLYTVRFTARELWGQAAHPADSVSLDLWEDYLEPA